jgi:hypothetical protein
MSQTTGGVCSNPLHLSFLAPLSPTQSPVASHSSLVQFLPDDVLEASQGMLQKQLSAPTVDVYIDSSVPSNTGEGRIEAVSELTGIALPCMYEHSCMGRITIQSALQQGNNPNVPDRLRTGQSRVHVQ